MDVSTSYLYYPTINCSRTSILKAIAKFASSVKRVIDTSSFAAILEETKVKDLITPSLRNRGTPSSLQTSPEALPRPTAHPGC